MASSCSITATAQFYKADSDEIKTEIEKKTTDIVKCKKQKD